jgi:RHS repeat-associated protein
VKTTYGSDDLDRITSIVYAKANGTILASETYTRNAGGEPSKVLREDGSYTLYEYDAAVRLSKEVAYTADGVAVKSIGYSYDLDGKRTRKVSNLVSQDYAYNANGQLATAGANGYSYDADGRLSTVTKSGGTVTLGHDAYDHLTQVTSNGVTTNYRYDAQGNRIGEVSGSNAKNYLVAPNLGNGLASTDLVTDGSGNVVSDYVYGGSSIIARLDANGEPLYYLTDSMGSVIGLVDGAGNIQSRIVYDGFGNVESGDDGSSLGGDFRFQGQWLEGESGLYYMRARDYDSQTGLFLSRDAVDVQQQGVEAFNPYQFAFNNPLVYSDPTGMFTLFELNSSISIQSILDAIEAQTINQVQGMIRQKVGELAGNLLIGTLKSLLPGGELGDSLKGLGDTLGADKGGDIFEDLLRNSICQIFQGTSFSQRLWIEPRLKPDGRVIKNGYNCDAINAGNYTKPDDNKKPLFNLFPGETINNPLSSSPVDFIFKQGKPTKLSRNDSSSYVVGDVKITIDAAYKSFVTEQNKTQSKAISNYAKNYEATHFALYTTFKKTVNKKFGIKETASQLLEMQKLAISRGIILFVLNILD